MDDKYKRYKLILELHAIIKDLENGYDGFMYLYDELCETPKPFIKTLPIEKGEKL